MDATWIAAGAGLLGAIVGGLISLVTTLQSNKLRLAREAQQVWVQQIFDNCQELLEVAETIVLARIVDPDDAEEFTKKSRIASVPAR